MDPQIDRPSQENSQSSRLSILFTSMGWPRRAWVRGIIVLFAAVTVLALISAGHFYFGCARLRHPITWVQAIRTTMFGWYVWAVLAPGIFLFTRYFSFSGPVFAKSLAAHLTAGLVCASIKLGLDTLFDSFAGPGANVSKVFSFQLSFLVYWGIVGACLAVHYYRFYVAYHQSALRASQLETKLAQAQLQILKMQLHPHFLFNTLNAIATLVHRDPDAADRMINRLSELLRFAVDSVDVQAVPLSREIELLESYLEIERTRFGERLQVTFQIDSRAANAKVPSLLLQPLVENAIQHGISRRSSGGKVAVRARLESEAVEIEVQDDGVGLHVPNRRSSVRSGVGLSNTRARLQNLYGDHFRLELSDAPIRGALVKLTIPFTPSELFTKNELSHA